MQVAAETFGNEGTNTHQDNQALTLDHLSTVQNIKVQSCGRMPQSVFDNVVAVGWNGLLNNFIRFGNYNSRLIYTQWNNY